jgi:PAS domain-containing protein
LVPDGKFLCRHKETDVNAPDATAYKQNGKEGRPGEVRLPGPEQVGKWEWDLLTNKYSWCPEMHRIFQAPPQLTPRTNSFLNGVHPEDRERVVKAFGRALVGKEPFHLEHRILWPDGSVRFVQAAAEVSFDQAGRPINMLGTIKDITGLRT